MAHIKNDLLIPEPTYLGYEHFLKEHTLIADFKNISNYISKHECIDRVCHALPCVAYILNYQTRQYLFTSHNCESVLGYTTDDFRQKGNVFFEKNMHPEDMDIFSHKIFKKFIHYIHTSSKEEIEQLRFSVNYRFKRKDSVYIHLLQQYLVLEVNKQNYPVLVMGFVTDISLYKKDDKVIFSISKQDKRISKSILTTEFFPKSRPSVSPREKEVIDGLIAGFGSKEIADKLNISLYTVLAHRRNLLHKANCKNTAELIRFAMASGLV